MFSLRSICLIANEEIHCGSSILEELSVSNENRLPATDESFRNRIFDQSPLPIVVMDPVTQRFLDCNPAAVRAYGFSVVEDVLGKTPLDVSAPTQYDGASAAQRTATVIDDALVHGRAVFEWLHQRPDGELWDAEVHLLSFRLDNRVLLQFSLVDITQRKAAERFQTVMHQLLLDLNSCDDLVEGLDRVLRTALQVPQLDGGGMFLFDPATEELNLVTHAGLSAEFVDLVRTIPADSPSSKMARAGELRHATHAELMPDHNEVRLREGLRAFAMLPIGRPGETIAVLNVASRSTDHLPAASRRLLESIALQVGGSLKRIQAESARRETEEIFHQFLDNSPVYVFFKDDQIRAIRLSRNFEHMLHRPVAEIIGRSMDELFPGELAKKMILDDQAILHAGKQVVVDEELEGRSYTTIKFPIHIKGKPRYLAGYTIDITDRKRAEQALAHEFERTRSILFSIPSGLLIYRYVAPDRLVLEFANDEAFRLTGIDLSTEIGRDFDDIWPTARQQGLTDRYLNVMRSGEGFELLDAEYGDHRMRGTFRVKAFAIPGGRLGTAFENVTKLKTAESAVRESAARFQAFMDHMPLMALIKDHDLRPLFFNREFLNHFPAEDWLGKTPAELFPPDVATAMVASDRTALDQGVLSYEEHWTDRNGRPLILETRKFAIPREGRAPDLGAIIADVSERRHAETIVQTAQKLEALGVLAGGIAHDFNNLLSAIFGAIDLARIEQSPEERDMRLAQAMTAMDRARALTQQLLTFAKGGTPVSKVEAVGPFVAETVKFALSGTSVSVRFSLPDDLWPARFDRHQIGQAIDNLVINACQAMASGGTLAVSAKNCDLREGGHPVLPKGAYVVITFVDHGVGIPKDHLSRIFDPFFTTKPQGHGLGLATCYSIVRRHGGSIDVTSEPGRGSTFCVYLPAAPAEAAVSPSTSRQVHTGQGTIVVMDDEPLVQRVLGALFESFGYSVILTADGAEAIARISELAQHRHDLVAVFLDLTIPGGMGGKAAIAEIRKVCPDLPAFVISGYADDPVIANPTAFGFTAGVSKPVDRALLAGLLATHLPKRS